MLNKEYKLQVQCVISFSQSNQRGVLIGYFAESDNYIQAAMKLSLGLKKGCSDLLYFYEGMVTGIEMKAPETSHKRLHIMEQCKFLMSEHIHKGYFCDSLSMFHRIINGGRGIDPKPIFDYCDKLITQSVQWDTIREMGL